MFVDYGGCLLTVALAGCGLHVALPSPRVDWAMLEEDACLLIKVAACCLLRWRATDLQLAASGLIAQLVRAYGH